MGSRRDCTWILGLLEFRVVTAESDGETTDSRLTIRIERRGVSTPGQNLTLPPVENLTVRRGDEPQAVATS
jgi:hypothetical protein